MRQDYVLLMALRCAGDPELWAFCKWVGFQSIFALWFSRRDSGAFTLRWHVHLRDESREIKPFNL